MARLPHKSPSPTLRAPSPLRPPRKAMPPPTSFSPTRIPYSLPPHLRPLPLPSPRAHLGLRPPPPPLRPRTTPTRPPPRASARGSGTPGDPRLDALLGAAEMLCLVPPAICSVVGLARMAAPPLALASGRWFPVQCALVVAAVAVGSLIRRRQWARVCGLGGGGAAAAGGVELVGRVEKVEEGVRSLAAAVGMLSRSVEKLGVRFRVARRALKDPIMETATLAQKNSEVIQILAAQEDILEKELHEIQKFLLAMQEQQQKQLELILAIGKASSILQGKQDLLEQANVGGSSPVPNMEMKELNVEVDRVAGGNNKP